MMMSFLPLLLVTTLTSRIHGIVGALREPILALPIVRDDSAINSARIIGGNAPDHDTIGSGRRTIVHVPGLDGELQIGFRGVLEAEVLVVIVGMGVFVPAYLVRISASYRTPLSRVRTDRESGLGMRVTEPLRRFRSQCGVSAAYSRQKMGLQKSSWFGNISCDSIQVRTGNSIPIMYVREAATFISV